jgi:RNA polymerase sigma factor (sigma-70 family)
LHHKAAPIRNKRAMALGAEDFEPLVRQFQAMLYRIAFNFFLSSQIAEEIVQDVFLQCFENLGNIEAPQHLKSGLRRAVTHRCIDVLRCRTAQTELQLDELPDVADAVAEPDPLLSERLRRLVASLPEKQRVIVILRYSEDLDANEIAGILGMPASTVRSYLQRALTMLREKAPRALGGTLYGPARKESS